MFEGGFMEESYFDEDTARRYMHDIISGLKYRRTWIRAVEDECFR